MQALARPWWPQEAVPVVPPAQSPSPKMPWSQLWC